VRGLILAATLLLCLSACRRSAEVIHPEPTEEGSATLVSVLNLGDPAHATQLVRGFHFIEQNAWRWTLGHFAVTLRPPEGAASKGAKLFLRFALPDSSLAKLGPTTLTVRCGSQPLGSLTLSQAGQHTFEAQVPAALLGRETVTFDFAVDKFLPAGAADERELGLIASTIGLVAN
jgi:hypothetical protein